VIEEFVAIKGVARMVGGQNTLAAKEQEGRAQQCLEVWKNLCESRKKEK
jgi:hypothetical protein